MFTLEYAKNPKFVNAEKNCIDLIVKWQEFNEEMPFGANPLDCEAHGRELFERAKAGEFGEVAPYVAPPEPTPTNAN
jgi:hypothetical protein